MNHFILKIKLLIKLFWMRAIIVRVFGSLEAIKKQLSFANFLQNYFGNRVILDTCLLKYCPETHKHLVQSSNLNKIDLELFLYPSITYADTSFISKLLSKIKNLLYPKVRYDGDKAFNQKKLKFTFKPIIFIGYFDKIYTQRETVLESFHGDNFFNIPVIINNFNRLTYTKNLAEWFQEVGFRKIYILDNQSTYPPLLDFYNTTTFEVIKLNHNYGHLAIWTSGFYDKIHGLPYIYTDPDVYPTSGKFPTNLIDSFLNFKKIEKVGPSIEIDDLPDSPENKIVLKHERNFWKFKIKKIGYESPIDTTLAIYSPYRFGGHWLRAIRLNDFRIRHLPWYPNESEEESFYQCSKKTPTHWGKQN